MKNELKEEPPFESLEQINKKVKTAEDSGFIPFSSNPDTTKSRMEVEAPVRKIRSALVNPNLPVFKIENQLLSLLDSNQVVVLTGSTGCGKSTQVPKMVYQSCIKNNKPVKIVCTQPRRLAASSLAQRVADEMTMPLGKLVGYQVGMDPHFSGETKILFVTTGIFLQRLIHERERFFCEFTHIVMDEVHERDIDIDFALIIVKHFLKVFPEVKLILMSATICSEKFSNYFCPSSIQNIDNDEYLKKIQNSLAQRPIKREANALEWGLGEEILQAREKEYHEQEALYKAQQMDRDLGRQFLVGPTDKGAPVISIAEGRRFPITVYWIEKIKEFFQSVGSRIDVQYRRNAFYADETTMLEETTMITLDILQQLLTPSIMSKVSELFQTPNVGSMLIFLPGYQEIMNMRDAIMMRFPDHNRYKLVLLHSSITATAKDLQGSDNKIFRIFLCTNIAESSITVPDCVFVIDYCLTKEIEYNPKNLTERLVLQYCSQASANQRSGRAGRLFPGICFRLVPECFFYDRMRPFSQCEMLRCPLEKIVLRIKKLDDQERKFMQEIKEETPIIVKNLFADVTRTLSTALDPPDVDSIGNSAANLRRLGALNNQELITKLGLFMCEMPIDIFLTRFILISCLIGCPLEGLTVAALLSQRRNFFQHQYSREQYLFLETLYGFDNGDEDDILIQLRIYREWEILFFEPYIQQVKGESVTQDSAKDNNRFMLRKFNRLPYSAKEINYANQRTIDLKNMREVLLQKTELLTRIENYYVVGEKMGDLYDPELVLKIKTAFAASFYGKAILIQRDQNKDVDRRIAVIEQKHINPQRCLTLENLNIELDRLGTKQVEALRNKVGLLFEEFCELNCYATKNQIRQSLLIDLQKNEQLQLTKFAAKQSEFVKFKAIETARKQKKWVRGVEFTWGSVLVHFNPAADVNELSQIFKRLMHSIELRLRSTLANNIKPKDQPPKQISTQQDVTYFLEAKTLEQLLKFLGCPVLHTGFARGYAQPNHKECQADTDSINFIQLTKGVPRRDYEKFLVGYDIKERESSKRNTCRMCVKIEEPTHWMQIIVALFGCDVKLVANESKSNYDKLVVDNRTFPLDHYILEEDVLEFNFVRQKISEGLLESQQTLEPLWPLLKKIISNPKERIHFDVDEKWVPFFEREKKELLRAIQEETSVQFRRKLLNPTRRNEYQVKFMADINAERPDFNAMFPRQFDKDGLRLFTQMKRLYKEWKLEQLEQCHRLRFISQRNEKAILVCKYCDNSFDQVGSMRGVKAIDEDDIFKPILNNSSATKWLKQAVNLIDTNVFSDRFEVTENKKLIEEAYENKCVKEIIENLRLETNPDEYFFITCPKKMHIFGFTPKSLTKGQKDCIGKIILLNRTVNLIYPNLEREEFNFRVLKHESICVKEKELFTEFNRKIQNDLFECKICVGDRTFMAPYSQLSKHITSQQHRENLDQLVQYIA